MALSTLSRFIGSEKRILKKAPGGKLTLPFSGLMVTTEGGDLSSGPPGGGSVCAQANRIAQRSRKRDLEDEIDDKAGT
jgi:hypothetical protein